MGGGGGSTSYMCSWHVGGGCADIIWVEWFGVAFEWGWALIPDYPAVDCRRWILFYTVS